MNAPLPNRPWHWRVFGGIVAAGALFSWLFLGADAVSPQEHQRYEGLLRLMRQTDAEINAAVLAKHLGLHLDYDPITQASIAQEDILAQLTTLPGFLNEETRAQQQAHLHTLTQLQREKRENIERFKQQNAILGNSLAFFASSIDAFIDHPDVPPALARDTGRFARRVMTLIHHPDGSLSARVAHELELLQGWPAHLPAPPATALANLLAHARLISERTPIVAGLTRAILETPTAQHGEALASSYAQAYEQALSRSHAYRLLLYLFALALAGYLAATILRLGRTSRDLAQRMAALDSAQTALRLYANVFTNASEGMTITDAQARIIAVNPAFTEITGYSEDDVRGKSPAVLGSGRQDGPFYQAMWETLSTRGQWQGEIWNRRSNGEIFPEWLSITAVRNAEGEATHYIGIFSDITERKEAEAHIRHLAHHDALTNLPNRALLNDRIEQTILQCRRNSRSAALLFLDLDRFKLINDTLGHEVGDALLVQMASRCRASLRESDTVARLGGDEFVVILTDIDHSHDVALIARKLLGALAQPYQLGQHALTVTVSIGVALYPEDGQSGSELLRNADAAMYRAKDEGRNAYQFYSADMNTSSLGELLLENQLRGAIERQELVLYYQPKVDARTGCLNGAEALLRWQHPDLGLLSPARFIQVAEETGLIVPISAWVLDEACRQLQAWRAAGLDPVPVAVNLSAQQFGHQDLVSLVQETLDRHALPPALINLELTETILMRNVERAIRTLTELRAMGVELSIDDFGSGYSSLNYLRSFPVQVLKIDRSFVHDIAADGSEGNIAAAVIALAHSLGQSVVAEGVETEAQRDFLVRQGCEQLQGYLFGRPEPAADFSRRLWPAGRTAPTLRTSCLATD